MTQINNDAEIGEYLAQLERVRASIETLQTWVDDFGGISPDNITDADVQDAITLANRVKLAINFASAFTERASARAIDYAAEYGWADANAYNQAHFDREAALRIEIAEAVASHTHEDADGNVYDWHGNMIQAATGMTDAEWDEDLELDLDF